MSIIKKIQSTILVGILILLFSLGINVNAQSNISKQTPSFTEFSINESSNNKHTSNLDKNSKRNYKITNGEIDFEPDINLNQKEQNRYDNCKKEVASKRVKRFKNKPTPCFKLKENQFDSEKDANSEIYNIIWSGVSENKEIMT